MTNPNLTHIVAVLDRSGSMQSIKTDTEGGWEAFIAEQRKVPGECFVTLSQFDSLYEEVYVNKPLADVGRFNLVPRGATALHDAIGRAVTAKGAELAKLPENERPGSVIVVVLTDGWENSSQEWTGEAVRKLVEQQQDVYSWNFVFMGSNQDAVLAGGQLGFKISNSLTYTGANTKHAFTTVGTNIANYRSDIAAGVSWGEAVLNSALTDEQRAEAVAE